MDQATAREADCPHNHYSSVSRLSFHRAFYTLPLVSSSGDTESNNVTHCTHSPARQITEIGLINLTRSKTAYAAPTSACASHQSSSVKLGQHIGVTSSARCAKQLSSQPTAHARTVTRSSGLPTPESTSADATQCASSIVCALAQGQIFVSAHCLVRMQPAFIAPRAQESQYCGNCAIPQRTAHSAGPVSTSNSFTACRSLHKV